MTSPRFLGSSRLTLVLACILVALHLGAASYRVLVGANETVDSAEYLQCAQNAANGKGFQSNKEGESFSEEAVTRRPPGYPAIILAMGQSKNATMGLQVILSLSTIGLCIFALRRFNKAWMPINFLLAGFIFTPSQVLYATSIMSEIPFQFFLTLGIVTAILFFEEHSTKWILISAIALSIALTIKPVLYPAAILFSIVGLIYALRKKNFRIVPAILIPVACVVAITSWNYTRTQVFEISSIQTTNLFDVNMKLVLYQAQGEERGNQIIDSLETEADKIKDYRARQHFRSQQSHRIFFEYPHIAIYQFAKGLLLFFVDPGRFDFITYAGMDNKQGLMNAFAAQDSGVIKKILSSMPIWLWGTLIIVFLFNIVKITFFSKFLIKGKESRTLKILLSCGIAYIALASGPLGVSRYALPVVPLILIGASLGSSSQKG